MKHKKAIAITTVLIFMVLGIILLAVVYFVFIKPVPGLGKGVLAMGPSTDKLCVTRSKMRTDMVDNDNDGRDDYYCDSCVCKDIRCNNNLKEKDGFDGDGDGLPAICDKDDKDKTNRAFNAKNCPEKKLLDMGTPWGKQCRPEIKVTV